LADFKASNWLYLHAGVEHVEHCEQSLAGHLGVSDRIRFLGGGADIRELHAAADVFVMPSLYEGVSIAALEAMGSGLPVIFTEVPGLRDFGDITDSIVWCTPEPATITNALEKVHEMPIKTRHQHGRFLSAAAHQAHNSGNGSRAYTALYGGIPKRSLPSK
jgi:glycosyltransferase involved in cell wall biosynthesis